VVRVTGLQGVGALMSVKEFKYPFQTLAENTFIANFNFLVLNLYFLIPNSLFNTVFL
jgi:hypothetical protein